MAHFLGGALGVYEAAGCGLQHRLEDVDVRFPDGAEALRVEGGLDEAHAKPSRRVPDLFEHETDRAFAIANLPDRVDAAEFRKRVYSRAP